MFTRKRLVELIDYNPETGIAIWKIGSRRRRPGDRVGTVKYGTKRSKPYRYVRCSEIRNGRWVAFTHIVHFYMTGRWPKNEIDHIHGDTLDDRWSEIRPSTTAQNQANRGARRNNKLGIKGVCCKKGKYEAAIYRRGSRKYLGLFDTPEAASAAYLAKAKTFDGQFLRVS